MPYGSIWSHMQYTTGLDHRSNTRSFGDMGQRGGREGTDGPDVAESPGVWCPGIGTHSACCAASYVDSYTGKRVKSRSTQMMVKSTIINKLRPPWILLQRQKGQQLLGVVITMCWT